MFEMTDIYFQLDLIVLMSDLALYIEKSVCWQMMASRKGNAYNITGPLWVESIGYRWFL